MTKKKVQKGGAAGKGTTGPTHGAEVALLLANVLAHPSTPKEIYNAIGEALTDIENGNAATVEGDDGVPSDQTPEHIERVLNAQDGLGHRAFGVFNKAKRPDGYARFELKGFDGEGRR